MQETAPRKSKSPERAIPEGAVNGLLQTGRTVAAGFDDTVTRVGSRLSRKKGSVC